MNLNKQKQTNTLVGVYLNRNLKIELLHKCLYGLSMQEKPVDVIFLHEGKFADDEWEVIKGVMEKPVISVFVEIPEDQRKEGGESKKLEYFEGKPLPIIDEAIEINSFANIFNKTFQIAQENKYDFFSVVECEDEIALKWYNTAHKYAEENPDTGVFLPLIRNTVGETFTSYLNEFCWAEGMAEAAGYYDLMSLTRFNCIHPLGALFRISPLEEMIEGETIEVKDGLAYPMKEDFKLTHYYEFFLRLIYNAATKIMNVPRVGYQLRHTTTDTYTHQSSKIPSNLQGLTKENGGMTPTEVQHWTQAAIDDYIWGDNDPERINLTEQ